MPLRAPHRFLVLILPITVGLVTVNVAVGTDYDAAPLTNPVVSEAAEPVVDTTKPDAQPPASDPQPPQTTVANSAPSPASSCTCCNTVCCTKKKREAATAAMKDAYKGVFYANDFRYLDDPCYRGPSFCGDAFKGLGGGKMDVGGEVRVRYQNEEGFRGLGLTGLDDQFWLTRVRAFANYRMNDIFRFYGEFLYADSSGQFFPFRLIEENRGDIQNLFFDTKLTSNTTLRLGRQELVFGAQRLVSPLDWANTRRTFQGGRLLYKNDNWDIDGFWANLVAPDFDGFDEAIDEIDFFGVYGTRKGLDIGTLDTYYLGLVDDIFDFDYHTIGSRVSGSTDNFLYELEGGFQFGSNSDGSDHDAGFFTGGLGKKLSICTRCGEWNPIVWFWYDWASGGDDNFVARGDNGFDHLFPLAHKYLGLMDLYGRRNINDVNFQFITSLGPRVSLLFWYHHFFLDQATTPYSVVMTPFNTTAPAGDKELGSEIDVLFNVALTPRDSMLIGYSHFAAGDYYRTTPGVPTDNDAQFFYWQFQKRF